MATAEQRAQLIAALSDFYKKNWAQIAPGDTGASEAEIAVRSERLANSFVEKAEAGDKSVYSGEQPLETFALNADGTGINPDAQEQLITDAAVHHADTDAAAQAPITKPASPDAPDTGMTISGTEAELRNDPAPRPLQTAADIAGAAAPDTNGAAAPDQAPAEQQAEAGAAGGDNTAATEPAPEAPTGPFSWDNVKAVYAPYSDGQESAVGNGNADKDNVHKIEDIKFFKLDSYHTMRQLAVYYGGYERDLNFRRGIEDLATQQGKTIQELLDPNNAQAQQQLHEVYKKKSLLLGNALEFEGSEFGMPLTEARLAKKDFIDKLWHVDADYVNKLTGNQQLAHGSNVLFKDKQGSIYKDNGQAVSMRMGPEQRFGAEHAINISRIYMSARQKPPTAEEAGLNGELPELGQQPQRIKFSIGSGLGLVHGSLSRKLGNAGEFARRRDLMILSALHQGQRAGMVPDLFVKGQFGREQAVGELKIENMSQDAVSEFKKMGIDVNSLIKYHNENGRDLGAPVVTGEEAVLTTPQAAPVAAAPVVAATQTPVTQTQPPASSGASASAIIMSAPQASPQDTPTVTRATPARPSRPAGPSAPAA